MSQANLPADEVIHQEIRDILSSSDLMTVTKKSIKAELERRYVIPVRYMQHPLTLL
jgi:chitin synthase